MDYLLFIGYLFLFAWLITRTGLFNRSGLSNTQLISLFLVKIIAGIFYGWVGIYYGYFAYMYDTWGYHNASVQELSILYSDPGEYFTNLFHSGYANGYGGFFDSSDSYWNDLKANAFIKMLSVFDLLSSGNYYINIIFFCFITLAGPVLLYRVLIDLYPDKKIPVITGTFLIPSFVYWTSGIHKDGIAFMAIALIIYHVYFGIKKGKPSFRNWITIFSGALILLAIRNYLLILMLPALFAWYLSGTKKAKTSFIFGSVYAVSILLFFSLRYISPALDFPQAVANRQQAFMKLEGGSGIKVRELEPSFTGFIKNLPQSFVNVTMRPFPADIKHMLSLGVAAENLLFLVLILLAIIYKPEKPGSGAANRFTWFCLFFAFSLLLTIGYTVNFQGAIVRYRSIILPFLITPLLVRINWHKLKEALIKN